MESFSGNVFFPYFLENLKSNGFLISFVRLFVARFYFFACILRSESRKGTKKDEAHVESTIVNHEEVFQTICCRFRRSQVMDSGAKNQNILKSYQGIRGGANSKSTQKALKKHSKST